MTTVAPGLKTGMAVPVLVGGAAAGFLSGLPGINCLCCLWILAGAALSVYLYSKDRPEPTTPGDGAVIGAFSGVAAAAVNTVANFAFQSANLAFLRFRYQQAMTELEEAELTDGQGRAPSAHRTQQSNIG